METNFDGVIDIDLHELFGVLRQKLWIIVVATIFWGSLMAVYSNFMVTPLYRSTSRVIVVNEITNEYLVYADLQVGEQLSNDYATVVTSRYVVEQVIEKFNLDTTYEKFYKRISISRQSNTRVLSLTVTDEDPVMAKALVDELREVATKRIEELLNVETVSVLEEGNLPMKPSYPSVPRYAAHGMIGAFTITTAIIIICFLLDDTIKTAEDVERYLKLGNLGTIPLEDNENASKRRSNRWKK